MSRGVNSAPPPRRPSEADSRDPRRRPLFELPQKNREKRSRTRCAHAHDILVCVGTRGFSQVVALAQCVFQLDRTSRPAELGSGESPALQPMRPPRQGVIVTFEPPTRVQIVVDHPAVRSGLAPAQTRCRCRRLPPARPGRARARATPQSTGLTRHTCYSAYADHALGLAAIIAGADGTLCKSTLGEEVVRAIRATASGRTHHPDPPDSATQTLADDAAAAVSPAPAGCQRHAVDHAGSVSPAAGPEARIGRSRSSITGEWWCER
jgi:hypothetical protein